MIEPRAGQRMSSRPPNDGGLIGVFVRHRTAPNLLMIGIIVLGIFSYLRLNRQFFPDFDFPTITVNVPWTGASASDVETNILDVLEPELRFLDNVTEVTSIAREGSAVISIEFDSGADIQKAQSDVEQAISRVVTLPEDSERPIISRRALFDRVANVVLSGPFSERVLKVYAKEFRDGLLEAGIPRVTFAGARDEEIWIQIKESALHRLGISIDDVAQRVRANTRDVPAGKLEGDVEIQLRAKAERRTAKEFENIEIRTLPSGEKILLKDVATVSERFEREGKVGVLGGEHAVQLSVQRALSGDTLETMAIMNAYLEQKRPELPPTLNVTVYDVRGKLVAQRLGILLDNGLQGLALVLLMLFIFLNARIAFWVAAGIPVAILAALAVMYVSGQSINMVSMFALIMMIGIIVDDAIVVGEHAETLESQGLDSLHAAEGGALTMFSPVMAASVTTLAAFTPIWFIQDRIGDIMSAIPLVVVSVLIASLVECFLILPGHLRHAGKRKVCRGREAFDRWFAWFRDHVFGRIVDTAYVWRYTTVSLLLALFLVGVGMQIGGRVGFQFFPSPEPEFITASVEFGAGMPQAEQRRALGEIEASLYEVERQLLSADEKPGAAAGADAVAGEGEETGARLVETVFGLLGQAGRSQGENLAQLGVQLTPSEARDIRTRDFIAAWRKRLPAIAGVERVSLAGRRAGTPKRDVDVRLQNAPVETLKAAAEELKEVLTGFPGVGAINDDLPYGKQEYVVELTARGAALGFTGASVGRQLRGAFDGRIPLRFARDDEEITVRVMREQSLAGRQDLERLFLVAPGGGRVPLLEVVDVSERRTFSIIQRKDGVRTVAVTADIDSDITNTQKVVERLETEVMPALARKYGLTYAYKGRAEEMQKSFADLEYGAMLALCAIYLTLAWVFGSYSKPFAVMLIIPFGYVGAVFGHYLLGYSLTIISMIGLLGLSGILVNDSIVLVTRIRERLDLGDDLEAATVGASRDRLRAVLLTSLTTIGGLVPLLFETSRQAQFLIPMAVTLVFGLAAATVLVLVLVPSLIGIGADIGRFSRWVWGRDEAQTA